MGPEPLPTPNSDLDSVRRDGAVPSRYRGTVRALLGLPAAEGENVTFARTIPPAGFLYRLHTPIAESSQIPNPLENTGPSDSDEAQANELQSWDGSFGGGASPHRSAKAPIRWPVDVPPQSPPMTSAHSPSPREQPLTVQPDATDSSPHPAVETRTSDYRGQSQHRARHRGTDSTSERDWGSVADTTNAGQSAEVLEHTTIAVPGISGRSAYAPALAPERPGDGPVSTVPEPPPPQVPPGDSRQQTPASSLSTEKAYANPTDATLSPHPRPRRLPSPSMHEGADGAIQELRRAVRRLAAEVASWQTQASHESREQRREPKLPRPAERVVIIKHAAPRSGPPRAFWERSYLGRMHWRTPR
jgi:hypothetical protein